MGTEYNKTVSGTNSVNLSNISFNTPSIAGYNKTVGSNSGSSGSGGRTTSITINLDELLTDNIEEDVTSEKIADPKKLESYKSFGEKCLSFLKDTGSTLIEGKLKVAQVILTGAVIISNPITAIDAGISAAAAITGVEYNGLTEKIYNEAGKVACDIGGFALGLLDGVLEFGEGLVDAAIILGAAAVTVSNPIYLGDLLVTGIAKLAGVEYNGITQGLWADVVMPAVGYDVSGAAMDAIYSIDAVAAMDENAHGPFKRGGGMYNVGKSVGTVTGTIALAVATGGTSIPLTVSTSSAVFAGMQKMGNSIESNYNKLGTTDKKDLGNIFAVNVNGAFKGLIEGGTWYLTYGNGLGKVGKFLDGTKLGAVFGSSGKTWFKFLTDKTTKILGLTQQSWLKGGLQAAKTYANWTVDLLSIGSNKTFGEVTWDAAVNAAISMFYDNAKWARKWFDDGKAKIEEHYTIPKDNSGTVDMKTDFGNIDARSGMESLEEVLKSTGANNKVTHEGSVLIEAYNKTGGTLIKKIETFLFDDLFVGGITPYLKRIFGGA